MCRASRKVLALSNRTCKGWLGVWAATQLHKPPPYPHRRVSENCRPPELCAACYLPPSQCSTAAHRRKCSTVQRAATRAVTLPTRPHAPGPHKLPGQTHPKIPPLLHRPTRASSTATPLSGKAAPSPPSPPPTPTSPFTVSTHPRLLHSRHALVREGSNGLGGELRVGPLPQHGRALLAQPPPQRQPRRPRRLPQRARRGGAHLRHSGARGRRAGLAGATNWGCSRGGVRRFGVGRQGGLCDWGSSRGGCAAPWRAPAHPCAQGCWGSLAGLSQRRATEAWNRKCPAGPAEAGAARERFWKQPSGPSAPD